MKLLYKFGTNTTIDDLIKGHRDSVDLLSTRNKFLKAQLDELHENLKKTKDSFKANLKDNGIDMEKYPVCVFDDDLNIIGKDVDDVDLSEILQALKATNKQ